MVDGRALEFKPIKESWPGLPDEPVFDHIGQAVIVSSKDSKSMGVITERIMPPPGMENMDLGQTVYNEV